MVQYICSQCRYIGKPRYQKRGSGMTEFKMWMLFPLGIPYSIWRICAKDKLCTQCGNEILIGDDTLLGLQMIAQELGEEGAFKRPPRMTNADMPEQSPAATKTTRPPEQW